MSSSKVSKDQLTQDIHQGLSQSAQGKKYRLSKRQISLLWKKYELSSTYKKFKKDREEYIVEQYLAGKTVDTLATELQVRLDFIYSVLKRREISIDTRRTVKERQETTLQRHGKENYFQTSEFLENREKLFLEKYGSKAPLGNSEIQEKVRNTCLSKYGVEWVTKSERFKEKSKNTQIEKYGSLYAKTQEFLNKKAITCLEKYGTEHPSKLDSVKQKIIETCQDRYGHDWACQSKTLMSKNSNNRYIKVDGTLRSIPELAAYYDRSTAQALIVYKEAGKDVLLDWLKNKPD